MSDEVPRRPRLTAADAVPVLQARRMLNQYGQSDDVQLIDRRLRGTSGAPAVVVVGEVKRGKSTLVNALTGADVSPTGAEVVTASVVAIVPPSPSLPEGRAEVLYADHRDGVPVEQATSMLVPGGEHSTPLGVRFAVTSLWVPGVALVDTPGVGGLSSAHGRQARRAAADATALLFVIDGGQTLTAPELEFLREVTDHTENVVIAMTKIDRNPGGWEQVRDENRALLRKHAPRFGAVLMHPVSAAYAAHARSQPADVAKALNEASGIPLLADTLRRLVGDQRHVAVVNALRAGHSGLERLEERVSLEIRALSSGEVRAGLESEQQRLAALQLQQRRGRLDLERDLGRVRQSALEYLNERADELTARMSRRIQQEKRGMGNAAKAQFAADLAAELAILANEVRADTAGRVTDLVGSAFGALFDADADIPGADISVGLADIRMRIRQRETVTMNPLLDPSVAGTAFMGSHLVGLLGVAGPVGLLLGGAAMVAINLGFRSIRQGQQELAGTLYDSIAGARQDLTAAVDSWLRELRPELHIALEDHLKRSLAAVRAVLAEADRAAREDEATRESTGQRLELRMEAVQARRRALEQRLARLAPAEHSAIAAPPTSTRQRSRS
ncbi:dynamin family protein [Tenggerimyces flavus]|uniref:Dynamin family protein n=1 Tax=Tenggerimyces flavus TaxID=1708749 RepID=A0ABV7YAY4_9ACTN|nr:dynamin family protein [Tenggerimyces flavus]MBM7783743.1 GTP-binding protein EngB required for normal cell division [Tenggerimyces flavus]